MLKIVIQVCKIHTRHHLGLKFCAWYYFVAFYMWSKFCGHAQSGSTGASGIWIPIFRTGYESPPKSLGRCGKANRSNSKSCFLFIFFFFCIILTELVNLNRNFHIITVLLTLQTNYIL